MRYADYLAGFDRHSRRGALERYATVTEGGAAYPLLRFTVPGAHRLLVTAGFHGDEVAGPLTLLEHLEEVVDHARSRAVGLRVYPCLNPTGFEDGTRYNRSGERPNNDFLRYEVAPGEVRGELRPGEDCARWALFTGGPQETRALRSDLEGLPPPIAALDIHQDPYLAGPLAYAYAFGARAPYQPLLAATAAHAPLARDLLVDDLTGALADADGVVELRDGSITDFLDRRGTRYAVALETTLDTPLAACHAIDLVWLHGMIELAATAPT